MTAPPPPPPPPRVARSLRSTAPPPWTSSGTCRSPSACRGRLPVSGAGEKGGAGMRCLRHLRATAASVSACGSRGRSDRAVPVQASRGTRTKSRAQGSGHSGLNLATARDPQRNVLVPSLSASWKPRKLNKFPTPSLLLRGACTANAGRYGWMTGAGGWGWRMQPTFWERLWQGIGRWRGPSLCLQSV